MPLLVAPTATTPARVEWVSVRLFGVYCAMAGMATINAADAIEAGGLFPWLKVSIALVSAGLAINQGRHLRAGFARTPGPARGHQSEPSAPAG